MERAAGDEMAAARAAAEAAPWPDPAAAFADVQDLGAPTDLGEPPDLAEPHDLAEPPGPEGAAP